jgi:phage portal protein BeeE
MASWTKFFTIRAQAKGQAIRPRSIAAYAPTPRRGSREVLIAFRENGWLQACVGLVSDAVAAPRWRAYKRVTSNEGRPVRDHGLALASFEVRRRELKALRSRSELVELPDHELLGILAAPNSEMSGRACLRLIQQHLDLVGEAFLWLQRGPDGRLAGFIPLPPHAITTTPTDAQPYFAVAYERLVGQIAPSDMIWLKHLDPERPHGRGAGRGLGLGDELDSSEFIARSLKSVFARGGLPTSVVGVDVGPDGDAEEVVEDLEKRFLSRHTGPETQGAPWFTPGKVTVGTINPDFQSLQTQELAKHLLDFIRMTYNVPPELMGDLSSSNRSTAEAAMYHLAEYATAPRLEFLRTELMHKLAPLVDPEVLLEYDDPRPKSFERLQALMTSPVTAPAFTLNEVRDLAGMEPAPELDGAFLAPMPGTFSPTQDGPPSSPSSSSPPPPSRPPRK